MGNSCRNFLWVRTGRLLTVASDHYVTALLGAVLPTVFYFLLEMLVVLVANWDLLGSVLRPGTGLAD
jgi:hypothetical protein